jgi:hypothetical protein
MRKYLLLVFAFWLMNALVITSCQKESSDTTFPLNGTKWIGVPVYNFLYQQFYNGDVMKILTLNGTGSAGTGTIMTIDNHTSRAAITITTGSAVSWTLSGSNLDLTTNKGIWKGDLSYSNQNVNFAKVDTTYLGGYLAFDMIAQSNALSTRVFKGTFVKVGTTTPLDCVWIFLSAKGWKMMVPNYPVTIYPLSPYKVDSSGKLLVDFFGGTASSAVPIDYTNHGGAYTTSNDSIVYTTTNVPKANAYPNAYNWRGVFRLKELK